jgi:hypothetical protein
MEPIARKADGRRIYTAGFKHQRVGRESDSGAPLWVRDRTLKNVLITHAGAGDPVGLREAEAALAAAPSAHQPLAAAQPLRVYPALPERREATAW